MNAKEELLKRQKQHAICMIAVWGILSVLNLSEILEQGIHDAGVRHWIILGLGMTAERILEQNKNELYMNRPL